MKSSYKRLNYRPLIVALTLVIGCAEDLVPDGGSGADGPKVQSTDNGDGTFTTTIDASADDQWVYLSLTDGAHVTPADPDDSASWDLAFQRFRVKSNSGISGVAGVEVAPILGADFDALTQAPARGYVVDAVDSDDEDTDADYAFLGPSPWYDYDSEQHTLSPANVVYVVKSVAGSYFKVQMQGYYDAAGTGGYPRFRWGPVEAPPVVQGPYPDAYVIDATEEDEWRGAA